MPVWISPRFGVISDEKWAFLWAAAGITKVFLSDLRRALEGVYSDFWVDRIRKPAQFVG